MASSVAPDTPRTAASLVFLAALVFSRFTLAQPLFEPVARDPRQAEIVDRIRAEQATNGAHSAALVEPLTALSFLYQENGDRDLAVAAIERALQVQRANYGLRTLEQSALIRQWITNAEMMGDLRAAWDLEQALLELAYRNPSDMRAVPIFREIGDKRIDLLERYAKGEEFLPEVILGCYYKEECHAGSRRVAIQGMLSEAQRYYFAAIQVMQRNELYSSADLRNLEMDLARTSYLHGRDPGVGRASLSRLLTYDAASGAPLQTRIESLVRIADWDLIYANGRNAADAVLAIYEAAYRKLEDAGVSPVSIEEIFFPETPVVLPTFLPSPLASERTAQSQGYVDVAFAINKYGKSRGIRIVGKTNGVTDAAARSLVRSIARCTFRPRLVAGRVVEDFPVVVRYYL